MNDLLCVAAIAVSLVAPSLAFDCRNYPCMDIRDTHTLCKYPNPNPAAACGQVSSVGVTEAEKTEIINKHNELRLKVATGKERRGKPGPQPAALNINVLFWDNELAEIAQRWANQCNVAHDDCRDVARFPVGQNRAMFASSGDLHTTPSDVIMIWYNEVEYMDRELVNNLTTVDKVGQYTQIVWAGTGMVGCGKIVYRTAEWNRYSMVCNYGPTGNFLGTPVYITQY